MTHDRCQALRNASPPINAKDLNSFLCSARFSSRFIKDMSIVTVPLKHLCMDGVRWIWSRVEQEAFEEGIAAHLVQINPQDSNDRVFIAFWSRTLTSIERKYSQCELEALAAVEGCEHYWIFLFGKYFCLVTDNRGVQLIFGNTALKPPARIECLGLRMTQFDYWVKHRPGTLNISDYSSRHPDHEVKLDKLKLSQETDRYVNAIVESAMPYAISLHEMVELTSIDAELQELKKWVICKPRLELPNTLAQYRLLVNSSQWHLVGFCYEEAQS